MLNIKKLCEFIVLLLCIKVIIEKLFFLNNNFWILEIYVLSENL